MDFTDSIVLLESAWNDLSKAIGLHREVNCSSFNEAATTDTATATTETVAAEPSVFSANGHLAAVLGKSIAQFRWIESASAKYHDLRETDITLAQCDAALDKLLWGLQNTNSWFLRSHSTMFRRVLRWLSIAAQVVFFLIALGGIGYGVTEYQMRGNESDGLSATYFSEGNFKGHPFTWIDATIDFDWRRTPPFKTQPRKVFSLRWEGWIYVEDTPMELVMESTESPSSFKIDGQDLPKNALSPGMYRIEIAYPLVEIPSRFKLQWKEAGKSFATVPTTSLIPLGGNDRFPSPASSTANDSDKKR